MKTNCVITDKQNTIERVDVFYEFERNVDLDYMIHGFNIPMWMFVRTMIASRTVYTAFSQTAFKWYRRFEHNYDIEYGERNPFNSKQRSIMFAFFNNQQVRLNEAGEIVEDRYYPYMDAYPEKTMSLVTFIRDIGGLKCAYPNWYSDLSLQTLKRNDSVPNGFQLEAKGFIDYLRKEYPFRINENTSRIMMAYLYDAQSSLESQVEACERLLDIVNPKIVYIELACQLGINKVAMVIACRRRGILTAEIAYTIMNHDVFSYNYEDVIINNESCRKMFVDYLLTKGEYWNDKGKVPCKRYAIGDVYNRSSIEEQKNENVLFLVSFINQETFHFLDDLMEHVDKKGYCVFFRPHPGYEENTLALVSKHMTNEHFIIADNMPLNCYLNLCKNCIITGPSTTIYEALSCGVRVFMMKKNFGLDDVYAGFPDVIHFDDIEDFIFKWRTYKDYSVQNYDYVYDHNWERNLRKFYNDIGVL